MRIATLIRYLPAAAIVAALLSPGIATAQSCPRKTTVIVDTDVYREVPRFITGLGWQGNRIASLPRNTEVYVCRERKIDFGLSAKDCSQIAFRNKAGAWEYGWVLKEKLARGVSEMQEASLFSPVAPASAASYPEQGGQTRAAPDKDEPPPLPPVSETGLPAQQESATSWGDLAVLYGPLFVAVLLGMAAKAAVDWLDAPRISLREHARHALIAFLVSPMVFLGFLNAGNFSTATQTTFVLLLMAFQNGFFWQAVLKRDVREPPPNPAAATNGGSR